MSEPERSTRWTELLAAQQEFSNHLYRALNTIDDLPARLREGIQDPVSRRACLRILLVDQCPSLKKELFDALIEGASVGHSDIGLVRAVIAMIPREWVLDNIDNAVGLILDGPLLEPEEEYRRFLELYVQVAPSLVASLAARALIHPNEEVRDAGRDFISGKYWPQPDAQSL